MVQAASFPQRQNAVGRKTQGLSVLGKIAIATGLARLGAQPAAVLQGALRYARREAIELLFVVICQHRVVAVFRRIIAAQSVTAGGRGIIFQIIIARAVIAVVISCQLFQKWLAVNIRFCISLSS